MLKFTKRMNIELSDGSLFEFRMLSITALEEFKAIYDLLSKELEKEEYKEISFSDAFKVSPLFRKYIIDLFDLFKLNYTLIPADTCYDLLFPHANADGSYSRQGLLITFLFGDPKDGEALISKEYVDAYAVALAQLWKATESFEETLLILKELNYEDLSEVLKIRADLSKSPEDRMKEKAKEQAIAALEKIKGSSFDFGEEIQLEELI